MPKETLKALERDAERLLFLGAALARTDADLLARRDKLAPVAAKVPAIGKVVEQIDAVSRASGKAAATELLNFSALMAQVRGAQAALATPKASGDLTPLPPAERIGTPLSPTELSALVGALTGSAEIRQRARLIRDYAERGAARDLRILPLALPALSDHAVSSAVEHALLPALGKAIVPDLIASLEIPQGKALDGRKIAAIAAILGAEARGLLGDAVEKGSAEVREAAIRAFGQVDPTGVEPIALELAQRDRSMEVRKAALVALGGARGDEALEVLVKTFETSGDLRASARLGLEFVQHPAATTRVIAMLKAALAAHGPLKIKRTSTREEKDAAAKVQKAHEEQTVYVTELMSLAARRGGQEAIEVALSAYRDHKVKRVREAAAQALLALGHEPIFDELAESIRGADRDTQAEFISALLALDPAKAFDRVARFFEADALKRKGGMAFAAHVLELLLSNYTAGEGTGTEEKSDKDTSPLFEKEPRWVELLSGALYEDDLQRLALFLLGRAPPHLAIEPLLKLAVRIGEVHEPTALAAALREYRDPRVGPALLSLLDVAESGMPTLICDYLVEVDDPAAAPALRRWLEAIKAKRSRRVASHEVTKAEQTLQILERDRASSSA